MGEGGLSLFKFPWIRIIFLLFMIHEPQKMCGYTPGVSSNTQHYLFPNNLMKTLKLNNSKAKYDNQKLILDQHWKICYS